METSYESWLADVVRRGYVVETCQVEPFTYVKMKYIVNGVGEFIGHGFAKKSPDDYWSPSSGVDIARIRAVSHIVGQLLERRGDMWLDSAGKAKERADKAKADLDVANKKIADMMDAMRDAVNDAKAEEDDGAPKPRSRVVVMNRPDEVVMFATINRKAADQIVRIASRFGSARVAENGHVWLYLNPCYDKREVIEWVIGKIDKGIAAVNVESPCEKKTPWRETGGGFTFSVTTSP